MENFDDPDGYEYNDNRHTNIQQQNNSGNQGNEDDNLEENNNEDDYGEGDDEQDEEEVDSEGEEEEEEAKVEVEEDEYEYEEENDRLFPEYTFIPEEDGQNGPNEQNEHKTTTENYSLLSNFLNAMMSHLPSNMATMMSSSNSNSNSSRTAVTGGPGANLLPTITTHPPVVAPVTPVTPVTPFNNNSFMNQLMPMSMSMVTSIPIHPVSAASSFTPASIMQMLSSNFSNNGGYDHHGQSGLIGQGIHGPGCTCGSHDHHRDIDIDIDQNDLEDAYYSYENQQIIKSHISSIFPKITQDKIELKWIQSGIKDWLVTGQLPSSKQIIIYLAKSLMGPYLQQYHRETNIAIFTSELFFKTLEHNLKEFGDYNILWIYLQRKYFEYENRFGTLEQLKELERNLRNIMDPNLLERKSRPTEKLDKLIIKEFKKKDDTQNDQEDNKKEKEKETEKEKDSNSESDCKSCTICFEDFKNGDKHYELPCKHLFHAKQESCEGLMHWLKDNDTCPVCRKEIIL